MTTDVSTSSPSRDASLDPTPAVDQPVDLQKVELEKAKIRLEIAELQRSPWTKPSVMIPIMATIVTLAVSQALGVFDVARQKLELQAREAADNLERLKSQTTELKAAAAVLEDRKRQLTIDVDAKNAEVAKASGEVARARREAAAAEAAATDATRQLRAVKSELVMTKTTLGAPRLDFEMIHTTTAPAARFTILNTGHGVATVRSAQWYVDDKPVDGGMGLKASLGLNDDDFRHTRLRPPAEIATGERIDLLLLEPTRATPELVEAFESAMSRARFTATYCSLGQECHDVSWSK